ncbi:glycosyltransferase family 2 protein [Candidatus Parcubacteria bacterium]|nr:glycosyltransferase family 2 protein [Candidatus Parcubacteria bacterium]
MPKKVSAIIPAFNEEKNIAGVLEVLLPLQFIDEVIVVDDGSADHTAMVAQNMGAKVLRIPKNAGKGNAMQQGVRIAQSDIIAFFDADLVGLTQEYVKLLAEPVLQGRAVMAVGIRGSWFGLPKLFAKLDPLLAISGQRVMARSLFLEVPSKLLSGFTVESVLNWYCSRKQLTVCYVDLPDLTQVVKEKKWGLARGLINRLVMVWQIIKIRCRLIVTKI